MLDFLRYGLQKPRILYPNETCDMRKWAVIACDQFTSQKEYWQEVEDFIGTAPSARRLMYPECYLKDAPEPAEEIQDCMREYLANGVLSRKVNDFVLVKRQTHAGTRLGLIAQIDLEAYDFSPDSKSLIRATESTILSRIPARVHIREKAALEMPHVMVLVNDPERTLIEPLVEKAGERLYDFDLMQEGGHITGSRVTDADALKGMEEALDMLLARSGGMLFAVGDGNHSLAAARQCWLNIKGSVPEAERAEHPMRYALVEICNIHGDGMAFEPIHRAIFGAKAEALFADFAAWCKERGVIVTPCEESEAEMRLSSTPVKLVNKRNPLPLVPLQQFLDEWLFAHKEASIDYIHGEDALGEMAKKGAVTICLAAFDKSSLFEAVKVGGVLPRKTFSMGDARDKRYYLETRALV